MVLFCASIIEVKSGVLNHHGPDGSEIPLHERVVATIALAGQHLESPRRISKVGRRSDRPPVGKRSHRFSVRESGRKQIPCYEVGQA